MADDASSVVSDTKNSDYHEETSDSFNGNNYGLRSNKRARHERTIASTNVTRFKGVVPQQNGHWGAQIYANHQRIWLGTFKSEKEAAMAYDSALIKLRSKDSHRNFPWNERNIQEPNFQNRFSTEAVLNMIKDGSYESKFADFLRTLSQGKEILGPASLNSTMVHDNVQFSCMQLFQKELTPSDVGKLNRLVIPKKYAVKYFPHICESNNNNIDHHNNTNENGGGVDDIELVFYDKLMRAWKFRYCYWRSSQSFVFTRGWNRFVKEKNLKEKDVITFYKCRNFNDQAKDTQNFLLMDVNYSRGSGSVGDGGDNGDYGDQMEVHLKLNLEQNFGSKNVRDHDHQREESTYNVEGKGFRLFGVQITRD